MCGVLEPPVAASPPPRARRALGGGAACFRARSASSARGVEYYETAQKAGDARACSAWSCARWLLRCLRRARGAAPRGHVGREPTAAGLAAARAGPLRARCGAPCTACAKTGAPWLPPSDELGIAHAIGNGRTVGVVGAHQFHRVGAAASIHARAGVGHRHAFVLNGASGAWVHVGAFDLVAKLQIQLEDLGKGQHGRAVRLRARAGKSCSHSSGSRQRRAAAAAAAKTGGPTHAASCTCT